MPFSKRHAPIPTRSQTWSPRTVRERKCKMPYVSSARIRSEEHTSELQSLMRNSYAVFCLKKKTPPERRSEEHTSQLQSQYSTSDTVILFTQIHKRNNNRHQT